MAIKKHFAIQTQPSITNKPMGIWLMINDKPKKLIMDVDELGLNTYATAQICDILNKHLEVNE